MNAYDDETLGAYVDGELDATTRAAIERALPTNPGLLRRVEKQRRLRRALGAAFDSTLSEPVPARLLQAAREPVRDTVVPIGTPKGLAASWRAPHWWAMAASLVVGALIGRQVFAPSSDATFVATGPNGTLATGTLEQALSRQLAGDRGGTVQIGLSYRARSGDFCRTFEIRGTDAAQAGLACREPEAWRVHVLEAIDLGSTMRGDMRQASSPGLPEAVRGAVESSIDGDVLDATAEATARDAGWR